ncbi:acyl-CoA transferase [Loktanella sp. M215]|uniref:acyl-CoA transferase n=1 Tax=Loktanella sp. M215 TaxID=2675431 RepID=UPI001F24F3A5|nr:acyl-CoA transferase [Loktanella sp. M215]MCF7700550.1 acyl-CoA transferase [Loktanella sp. M215]
MPSKRETVMQALFDRLQADLSVKVLRDDVLPSVIPPAGVVILRDGNPGEPEILLSPLSYTYTHAALAEVFVQSDTDRAALFDAIGVQIDLALTGDCTLGGACEWVEAAAPDGDELPIDGAATIRAVTVQIDLTYTTTSPLS